MTTSDEDTFEESSGTADSTVSYKYAQIVVPKFAFDVTSSTGTAPTFVTDGSEKNTRITSGSSFIRLGSFPDLTATSPSGFSNSVTLAKLVGDPTLLPTGADEIPSDGILRTEDAFDGDDSHLLGFDDDTRVRDPEEQTFIAGQTCDNTLTARQQETKRLLTKGGWWDHSDGNRVTTTSGDKVEVIQGNYKMVVLGRKDPSDRDGLDDAVVISDASGGNTIQEGIDPEGICVEYSLKDGVWSILQSETGNQTAKFHGKQVDYFTGPVKESYIGYDPDEDEDEDNYPDITDKTWAKTIKSYTGSLDKPIDTIFDQTYAKAITEERFAAAINTVESAAEITETRTALVFDTVVGNLTDITVGAKVEIAVAKFEFIAMHDEMHELKTEVASVKTGIHGVETKIQSEQTKLTAAVTKLQGDVTELNGQMVNVFGELDELGASNTQIAGDVNILACLMVI
jgi:hypothetical protein